MLLNLYKFMSLDTCKNVNILTALNKLNCYLKWQKNTFLMKKKNTCVQKHKAYFKKRLMDWKNEIIESNNKNLYLNEVDHEISSPDIVDQASSQTEKNVEMRTVNRQRKFYQKLTKAIKKIEDNTYGYCEETGEPIG